MFDERLEHAHQRFNVQRMQADGRLVEDEHGIALRPAHLAGQLQPLRLAAGKAGRLLAESQIAKSQVFQHLQTLGDELHLPAGLQRRVYVHGHQLRQREALPGPALIVRAPRVPAVARAVAGGAGDVHVRQELHVQTDNAGAVAGGAAQSARVVGKVAGLVAEMPGLGGAGEDLAQFVVDVGVGGHRGAHVDADGRGVDELDLRNAGRFHGAHVLRQPAPRNGRLQRRDEAFEDQRGLARAGYAGDDAQPPLGKFHFQRPHGVDGSGGKPQPPEAEQFLPARPRPQSIRSRLAQKRPDAGGGVRSQLRHRSLRDDAPAVRARAGAHLHQMVGFGEYLRIVIHQQHGIAVRHQIAHHPREAGDVGGMQPDGGLVQHV